MTKTQPNNETTEDMALEAYADTKDKWADLEHSIRHNSTRAGKAGVHFVHKNPLRSVAIAGITGLTIGLLLSLFRN